MGEDDNAGPGSRGWWRTLPGVLTAIAALLSAVTGLIVAVNQIRPRSDEPSTPASVQPASSRRGAEDGEGSTAVQYRAAFSSGTRARVGEATYEILDGRAARGNPGELELRLTIRMTNDAPYDANFWDQTFRLLVDDVPRAPTSGLNELVAARSAKEGTVTFVVPADARRLALLVGTESDAVRLPLELRPAGR